MLKALKQTELDKKNAAEFLASLDKFTATNGDSKLAKFIREEIKAGRTLAPKRAFPK